MNFLRRAVSGIPVSVFVLTGIIAGICCGSVWDPAWLLLILSAALLTGWRRLPPGVILCAAGFGAGLTAQILQRPAIPEILQTAPGKGVYLTAAIRVADPGVSALPDLPNPRLIRAELRDIILSGETEIAVAEPLTVFLQIPSNGSLPQFRSGDVFTADGILERAGAEVLYTDPAGNVLDIRLPDRQFQNYLRSRGAAGSLRITGIRDLHYEPRWRDRLCQLRDFLAARLLDGVEDLRIRREMASLFLGCRTAVPPEERAQWVRSGTIHLFSVSGMHVGVIAGVLLWMMRMMPFRLRYGILPLILLVYVLSSGGNVPAVRAWCMVAVWSYLRAGLCWMPNVQVLLWTASALLLWNTDHLTDMGFLYSFVITGTLLLLAERFRDADWMRDPLPWMPESAEKAGIRRFLQWRNWILCAILACSFAFLSGSVITLCYQGMFPVVSIAANLALIPVVSLIFPLAAAKIILCGILPGQYLALPLTGCWHCLHIVTDLASAIGSTGAVAAPSVWEIVLFYSALLAVLLPGMPLKVRFGAVGGMILLITFWHWNAAADRPALLICSGGRAEVPMIAFADPVRKIGIVVNAPAGDAVRETAEFFHRRGIDRIDELHFTQSRTGTLGGLETLLRQMPVSLMVLPERDRYGWRFEEKCRALALQMPEIRWKESGGSVECDPAGTVFCRAPEIWRVDWQENGMKVCWNGREFYRQKNAGNRLECTIYE